MSTSRREFLLGLAALPLLAVPQPTQAAPIHCPRCAAERGVSIPARCPHRFEIAFDDPIGGPVPYLTSTTQWSLR